MKRNTSQTKGKPLALHAARPSREIKVAGFYSSETQTWSNRNFEALAAKKHCEAR
jgi:hypothetical protein